MDNIVHHDILYENNDHQMLLKLIIILYTFKIFQKKKKNLCFLSKELHLLQILYPPRKKRFIHF